MYCPFTDEECINEKTTCSECILSDIEEIDDIESLTIDDIDYLIQFENYEDYLPLSEDELPF